MGLPLPTFPAVRARFAQVRGRLGRPPLPITVTVVVLLTAGPALVLSRWPRPTARGLEQLMAISSLLQSFPATPDRPPPALWQQRLGPRLATRLWRQQRGVWWQIWSEDAGAAAALAFTAPPAAAGLRPPAGGVAVDDLWVISADPLARQLLQERLRPQRRASRGVQRQCLQLMQREQAVFWNPTALGPLLGPLASLLQRYQEGCLALGLEAQGLRWAGAGAAVDGLLTAPAAMAPPGPQAPPPPLRTVLLEVEGRSLQPLLGALVSKRLIREPLQQHYGLGDSRLQLLLQTPFRLELLPRSEGPYQASLALQLEVAPRGSGWQPLLQALGRGLKGQGLEEKRPGEWQRADGTVLGGWRWLQTPGLRSGRLLFTLGASPSSYRPATATPEPLAPGRPGGWLQLRLRPEAMAPLQLLPSGLPALLGQSAQLWTMAEPVPGEVGISRLRGGLQLGALPLRRR